MAKPSVKGKGTPADPWVLKTQPGTSEYRMYRDESADPPALVCVVGSTKLSYHLRCIEDLHATLFHAMGISPKLAYETEKRPFYVTRDGEGKPIHELFAAQV